MKIRVSAKTDRFRRAGHEFTREPRELDVDAKTLLALKAEALLVVEEIREEGTTDAGKQKGGK